MLAAVRAAGGFLVISLQGELFTPDGQLVAPVNEDVLPGRTLVPLGLRLDLTCRVKDPLWLGCLHLINTAWPLQRAHMMWPVLFGPVDCSDLVPRL